MYCRLTMLGSASRRQRAGCIVLLTMVRALTKPQTGLYFGPVPLSTAFAFAVPTGASLPSKARPALARRNKQHFRSKADCPPIDSQTKERSRMDAEQLLVAHFDFVKTTTASICRRYSIFGDDAADVLGDVELRLVRDDYAALKQCRNWNNPKPFLRVLISRVALDWMVSQWGKWRPTALARRLGPAAVLLERLILRDGMSRDEAILIALNADELTESREELMDFLAALPLAPRSHTVRLDDQVDVPGVKSAGGSAATDESLSRLRQILDAMQDEVQRLGAQDKIIIKMKYFDGFKGRQIAETVRETEQWVFRCIYKVMKTIRTRLEARGIEWSEVRELFDVLDDDHLTQS